MDPDLDSTILFQPLGCCVARNRRRFSITGYQFWRNAFGGQKASDLIGAHFRQLEVLIKGSRSVAESENGDLSIGQSRRFENLDHAIDVADCA